MVNLSVAVGGLALLGILLVLLGSGVWVGVSLLLTGLISLFLLTDSAVLPILTTVLWNNTHNPTLMALPLFIFMGEILSRTKISENLFKGLSPWVTFLPGRLMHLNIFASGIFAAVSGSSAATTITVGRITLPELLEKRNYNRALSVGTLAGAGTLGFLIPPSTMMIIYGIAANVSIGKLFIAGLVPGIMIIVGLSGYIIVRSLINPELTPKEEGVTWNDRIKAIPLLLPVVALLLLVLGSIYAGWATPTEAASIGVFGALLIAVSTRSLSTRVFTEAMTAAVRTTGLIMLIIIGASYLSISMGYLGIPEMLSQFVNELGLSKYQLIIILTILYILLGMVLEGASMILMTLPLVLPLVVAAGFDPLWFGIYLILMIEVAQITPPVGFNLFVINSIVKDINIFRVAFYALPSFLVLITITAILTLKPEIVHWLPNLMSNR